MDVDQLPSPAEVWWLFAALAAVDTALGGTTWTADARQQVLRYDGPDGSFCLQRLYRQRMVLWARPAGSAPVDVLGDCPNWALSDALRGAAAEGVVALAWHAHSEWDSARLTVHRDTTALVDHLGEGLAAAAAALGVGPDAVHDLARRTREGVATADDLAAVLDGRGDASRGARVLAAAGAEDAHAQGSVRDLLATAIREQMRETPDRERILPQRPAVLVRWVRVADPPQGFAFAVCADDGVLVPASDNHRLPEQFEASLLNVLRELHHDEAADDHGAWLFARVTVAGALVGLDRVFDGWPAWFTDPGPALPSLAREMARRAPHFRPAWARLLPE